MDKKKKKKDYEYLLYNSFPSLYKFFIAWKEIEWKYESQGNQRILLLPGKLDLKEGQNASGDSSEMQELRRGNIIINSVAGFSNPGYLRKHMNSEFQADFASLKKQLGSSRKTAQIKTLESLMGQTEDIKYSLIGDYPFDGRSIRIFNLWTMSTASPMTDEGTTALVLKGSESFVLAFLSGVDDIVGKLRYYVTQLEAEDSEENDPLTFKLVGQFSNQERLNDLFNELVDSGLILKDGTYIFDFKRIFSSKAVRRKIIWKGNYEELYWFIFNLKKAKQIENPGKLWIKTAHCFAYQDPNTAIAITQLSGAHKPTRSKMIEDIINRALQL